VHRLSGLIKSGGKCKCSESRECFIESKIDNQSKLLSYKIGGAGKPRFTCKIGGFLAAMGGLP